MKQEEYKWNEKLWKPIIRPPRYQYKLSGLGSEVFMVQGIIVKRIDFTIKNNRNLLLQCSLFEPIKIKDKPHPCIIYLHGNSGCRIESHSIIDYMIPSYISVCGIDLSGSGQSQGEYISLGYWESQDVQCLYNYLRQEKYSCYQLKMSNITSIGLWGRSMGSVAALLSARENPNFRVIICDSPFSNFYVLCQDLAKSRYHIPNCCFNCCWCFIKSKIQKEANFNVDDLNLLSIVQTLQNDLSIIFLQAKQDELIQNKHATLLMENFKGKKKLIVFEGTHNSQRPKEVMEETADLIKKEFGFECWNQNTFQKEIQLSSRHSSVNAPLLRASKTSIIPQTEDTEQ